MTLTILLKMQAMGPVTFKGHLCANHVHMSSTLSPPRQPYKSIVPLPPFKGDNEITLNVTILSANFF